MKAIKSLVLFAIVLLPNILKAQSTETRKVSSFSELKVGGSFATIITKGDEESVKIEAEGIDTKRIITEQKGNELRVYLEPGMYRNTRVKVFITFKSLTALTSSGSGSVTCESDLEADNFNLDHSGSGSVAVHGKIKAKHLDIGQGGSGKTDITEIETDDLTLGAHGSGSVSISAGSAKNQVIKVSGSGGVHVYGVSSDVASVTVSGSGSVNLTVNSSLQARTSGSGNINYRGDATNIIKSNSGSGRTNKA